MAVVEVSHRLHSFWLLLLVVGTISVPLPVSFLTAQHISRRISGFLELLGFGFFGWFFLLRKLPFCATSSSPTFSVFSGWGGKLLSAVLKSSSGHKDDCRSIEGMWRGSNQEVPRSGCAATMGAMFRAEGGKGQRGRVGKHNLIETPPKPGWQCGVSGWARCRWAGTRCCVGLAAKG